MKGGLLPETIRQSVLRAPFRWSVGVLFALCLFHAACARNDLAKQAQEREKALVASFDSVAIKDLGLIPPGGLAMVEASSGIAAGWVRRDNVQDGQHSQNIERTQSLTTPYVATNRFIASTRITPRFARREDAEIAAPDFEYFVEHLHTYGYQDGRWVLTSAQCRGSLDSMKTFYDWHDCEDRKRP